MMNRYIQRLNAEAVSCPCGNHQPIQMHCLIEKGALKQVSDYLRKHGYHSVTIVADQNTFHAAGHQLCDDLTKEGIQFSLCLLQGNDFGQVSADESSIVQVMLEAPKDKNPVIAVGTGTIHDIARFVSYKMDKPFISVPTAASVDGFTSAGAPLMVRGVKQTVQAVPPIAIFADVEILMRAPKELNAAGFGDMLGKFTSLADWRFSRYIAREPYCPLADRITEESLMQCLGIIDEIAKASAQGIRTLMIALVKSGLSMLIAGHSRPASGAEHHLSHVWEMEHIKSNQPQPLHGAKVGVASVIICEMYRKLSQLDAEVDLSFFARLPEPEQMRKWLRRAGAPATLEEIDISGPLALRSLKVAHKIRDRYTGLKFINEKGIDIF